MQRRFICRQTTTVTRSMWFVHFGFSAFSCTNWISSEDELKVIKEVVSTFSFGSDLTLRCYACNPRCCNTVQGVYVLLYQCNSHEKIFADVHGCTPLSYLMN